MNDRKHKKPSIILPRRQMLRGGLGLGAALATAGWPGFAWSQDKVYKIYRVTFRGRTEVEEGFDDYLAAQGIQVEFIERNANRDRTVLPGFVEEIRAVKPDLVYTWGTSVTLGIVGRHDAGNPAEFIQDIPAVFALVSAPVPSGVVTSRERPNRNITGAVHIVPTLTQLRAMAAYKPYTKVGVIYTPTASNSQVIVGNLKDAQSELGFELIDSPFPIGDDGQPDGTNFETMVRDIKNQGADWLFIPPDTYLGTLFDRLKVVAPEVGLPTFGTAELAIRDGAALVGLVSRYYSVGQLAASKAQQILVNGTDPGTIPIETLKRFSLIVNMPMAHQLGVYPPLEMLNYAEVLTDTS